MATQKKKPTPANKTGFFTRFSTAVVKFTGSKYAFFVAIAIVLIWAATGPIFNYSEKWQLVINTGTTIITFLMVFVIQQSQNRDTTAIQLKLNELIASDRHASNRLIDIEDLSEEELAVLKNFYVKLADLAKNNNEIYTTHSLDEATEMHQEKAKIKPTK